MVRHGGSRSSSSGSRPRRYASLSQPPLAEQPKLERTSPTNPDYARFTIAKSMAPDTIRVYADDSSDSEIVCTIRNLSQSPVASWGAAWQTASPQWQQLLTDYAVDTYRIRLQEVTT